MSGKAALVLPLFSKAVVGDQHRVAIRLPSLYAAEWLADHSEVHRSDPSHCETCLTPVRLVDEGDMITVERNLLRCCGEVEPTNPNSDWDADDIKFIVREVHDA